MSRPALHPDYGRPLPTNFAAMPVQLVGAAARAKAAGAFVRGEVQHDGRIALTLIMPPENVGRILASVAIPQLGEAWAREAAEKALRKGSAK